MDFNYVKVCIIYSFEFGYYKRPSDGCVDEYEVVARYWDSQNNFLDEKILSYEDSPGEAVESLSFYVTGGYTFSNCYGEFPYKGGYYLVRTNEGYQTVRKGQFIDYQTDQLMIWRSIIQPKEIVEAVKENVDDKRSLYGYPLLSIQPINDNSCSLSVSWK